MLAGHIGEAAQELLQGRAVLDEFEQRLHRYAPMRSGGEVIRPKFPGLERERFSDFSFAAEGSVIFELAGEGAM